MLFKSTPIDSIEMKSEARTLFQIFPGSIFEADWHIESRPLLFQWLIRFRLPLLNRGPDQEIVRRIVVC